jgi:hypothetical protein
MKKIALFAAVGALLILSTAAQANPLPPGGAVVPDHRSVSGTILADTGFTGYTLKNNAGQTVGTGSVQEEVIADALNPFGAGDLSFVYQVHVDTGDVGRLSATSFAGFLTDAAQFTGQPPLQAGSVAASVATRSSLAADNGATVGFNFIPAMTPGQTSLALIVSTNATRFQAGEFNLIDGGISTTPGFAPQVPEPASLVLFGGLALGLTGAGLRRWRQNKAVTA